MSDFPTPIPPELEGVVNALAGWAGTHNPYLFQPGKEVERDAWACGWKVVQDFAQERADRAVALAETLGPVGAAVDPVEPLTQIAGLKFVLLTHFNLARQRLIWQHDIAERRGNHRAASAYAHAVSILGEEYEAARTVGSAAAEDVTSE